MDTPFQSTSRSPTSVKPYTYGPYNPAPTVAWTRPFLLECHVPLSGQGEVVRIMKEARGDRLVKSPLEGVDDEWITPKDLEGPIVVMVDCYSPSLLGRSGTSASVSEEDGSKAKKVVSVEIGRYILQQLLRLRW